jgi:hypothetical protein
MLDLSADAAPAACRKLKLNVINLIVQKSRRDDTSVEKQTDMSSLRDFCSTIKLMTLS